MTTESKQYWTKLESLCDSTVIEVVTERGGKVLQMRNSNYKIELTASAAAEITARYGWTLTEVFNYSKIANAKTNSDLLSALTSAARRSR